MTNSPTPDAAERHQQFVLDAYRGAARMTARARRRHLIGASTDEVLQAYRDGAAATAAVLNFDRTGSR